MPSAAVERVPPTPEAHRSRVRINRAARVVLGGGVIAYPTEGVYGIGCLAFEPAAVERVLAIKHRSWRKGLALIAWDLSQLEPLVILPGGSIGREILASWPGPVTWVLKRRSDVPSWITGGRDTLAVRVTDHPLAAQLCRRVGPLVSTSANRSGRPALTTPLKVRRVLGAELDYVLAGPLGDLRGPTLIRNGADGRVLRPL